MNPKAARRLVPAVTLAILSQLVAGVAPHVTLAAAPSACQQVDTTVTCLYLSGDNVFAVPAGVTTVHVVAIGGHGGQNGFGVEGNTGSIAGHGAMVTADVDVTPGASLHAVVGGNGTMYTTSSSDGGGANGGGAGSANFSFCLAGGGGGASDIRTDAMLASRILVAGGGGGAGCDGRAIFNGQVDLSTASGGDAGADGRPQLPSDVSHGSGGQAGCALGVSTGCGGGGIAGTAALTFGGLGVAGGDGALGMGGDAAFAYSASGGGGGGGYFGGGAGGGDWCVPVSPGSSQCALESGAGGGGGSSLVPPGGTLSLDTAGIPKIVITYTAPALSAGAHAQVSPASVAFSDVVVGRDDALHLVTLTSTGLGDLHIASIGFDGAADGFALGPDDCGTMLPSQWTCSIPIRFEASSVGPHSATLSIQDDAAEGPQTVTLTANGIGGMGALASIVPASLDFGAQAVGTTSAPRTVTITNVGTEPISADAVIPAPANGFARTGTCVSLQPGASCSFDITFTPPALGAVSAHALIFDPMPNSPQIVDLVGAGVPAAPAADLDTTSLGFGSQALGVTSASQTVTLSNTGTGPLAVTSATMGGSNVADFVKVADACSNATVAPGSSCTVQVAFKPTAIGVRSAVLRFSDDAGDSPQAVSLSGTGAAPVVQLSVASFDFGTVGIGQTSGHRQLTITNTGNASLLLASEQISGANATDFAFAGDTCIGNFIAAGSSCTLDYTFTPSAAGLRSAVVTITDNALNSPHAVSFTGTGGAPASQLSVTSLDFGTVEIGQTSTHRRLTITNVGDTGQNLLLTSEQITGANPTDFAFAGDTCIGNFIVAGASCTIDYTFTPSAAGARSATVTIADNGLDSPHTVSLTGTGGTPSADLAASIAASPNPVKSGTKVTYTITILNAGPSTARSIVINDSLSSQSTFVSASISQGTCVTPAKGASGVVSCSLASLASGASQPIQIVVTVIAKKNAITNTVTVSAATADPVLANNTAAITTRVK